MCSRAQGKPSQLQKCGRWCISAAPTGESAVTVSLAACRVGETMARLPAIVAKVSLCHENEAFGDLCNGRRKWTEWLRGVRVLDWPLPNLNDREQGCGQQTAVQNSGGTLVICACKSSPLQKLEPAISSQARIAGHTGDGVKVWSRSSQSRS